MAGTNNFQDTVAALYKGLDNVVSTKTVVGDPITVDGITLLPLIDVSFGIGAGSNISEKKDKGSGGAGGKITASAVLVIKDGNARIVNIKNQDTISKLIDLVPEVMDKITTKKEDQVTEEDVDDLLNKASEK